MYILPHKYTNIRASVLGIASLIVDYIIKNGTSVTLTELQDHIVALRGVGVRENFYLSLYFLFSLGKISYSKKTDSINLII